MGRINDWEVEGEEEKKNMEENKKSKTQRRPRRRRRIHVMDISDNLDLICLLFYNNDLIHGFPYSYYLKKTSNVILQGNTFWIILSTLNSNS